MEPETKSQMNYKVGAALLIGIVLGGSAAWVITSKGYQDKASVLESNLKEEIRTTLQEKGVITPADTIPIEERLDQQEEQGFISGTIAEMSDTKFVIETLIQNEDILSANILKKTVVNLTEDTRFITREDKDFETYDREQRAWDQLVGSLEPEDLPAPPTSYIEKEIAMTDLRTGDSVSVTSDGISAGEDNITASIVILEPRPQVEEELPEPLPEEVTGQ